MIKLQNIIGVCQKVYLNKFIYNDSILISIIITRLYPESIDDDYDQMIGLFTNDNIIINGSS